MSQLVRLCTLAVTLHLQSDAPNSMHPQSVQPFKVHPETLHNLPMFLGPEELSIGCLSRCILTKSCMKISLHSFRHSFNGPVCVTCIVS